jgi:hypothetical protein
MHRGLALGIAAVASLSLLGTAAPAASAAPSGEVSTSASNVIKKVKYGPWKKMGPNQTKCRIRVAVVASKTKVKGTSKSYCKKRISHTVVGIMDNGGKDYPVVRKIGMAKHIDPGTAKAKNRRGKQKICMAGYAESPLDGGNPGYRSEKRVCIKA